MMDLLVTVSVALVGGVALYVFGFRTAGKVREAKETKQRLEDMKTAQEVRDEVEVLDDTGLADRASKWLRK